MDSGGASDNYGTRPRRRSTNRLSSLAVRRVALLLFGVSILACLLFISFSKTLTTNMDEESWDIPPSDNNFKQEAALYKSKYENIAKDLNMTKSRNTKEMEELKSKYNSVVAKLRTLEENKQKEKQSEEHIKENPEHGGSTTETKKLNILLLYADDWRHDSFNAAGNKVIETPVLNKLAKEGMMFSHNCVTTSICGISRATLQTGQWFSRHQVNPHKRDDESLPGFLNYWNETLNGLLRSNGGYYVGFVGKWQIRGQITQFFDVFKQYFGYHVDSKGQHITERNEKDALEFLKERPTDKPFFLTVSFFATHAVDGDPKQYIPQNRSLSLYTNATIPMSPSATEESWNRLPDFFLDQNEGRSRWRQRYRTPEMYQHHMKNMYRMVSEVDSTSGRILHELEKQGVLDDTLVIFTTDNGNFHAEHGLADKWYPHQESIRVPLVIKDPRMPKDKIGTVSDHLTLNVDLAPTIVSAAGIKPPERMQGHDISQLYLEGSNGMDTPLKWRQHFFYEHPVIDCEVCIPSSEALVVKDSSKYVKYFLWPGHGREQLFDLRADPFEENDLIHNKSWAVELQALRHLFNMSKKAAL